MSFNTTQSIDKPSRVSNAISEFISGERELAFQERLEENDLVELGIMTKCHHCPEEDFNPFNLLED